ncbi:hypothetical protein HMPREF0653_01663, partial [Prevotella disiens JCM 6334 = ATCC 29426]
MAFFSIIVDKSREIASLDNLLYYIKVEKKNFISSNPQLNFS